MKNKSKFYELELIDNHIRKVSYKGRQGCIYNFKYSNLNRAKKELDKLDNGIYFVRKDDESMDLYIGQTTNGLHRFTSHSMKKYQETSEIFFYSFSGEKPNRNLLDYIEMDMISRAKDSRYKLLNDKMNTTTTLAPIDQQYFTENVPTIINILKVFGIDFSMGVENTQEIDLSISTQATHKVIRNYDEIFAAKGDNHNITIAKEGDLWIMKKGSFVGAKVRWESDAKDKPFPARNFYEKHLDLVGDDNILKEDIAWKTISALVAFGKGNLSNNGWTEIYNKDDKTPHQLYREEKQSDS